ncbi:maltose acetyltransferase domain-containing protein [Kineothrix sp. MB12-C1]|uniref:maltose acetyltransferase domain-containing protein n=1 Tax=Kineothrix sp. MB12-C1 TaxID=3070215 RepID=UPI0027D29808|nr:maltose acetyltransferase domain-containing protein [Kineothrix sp. MB12-C1]WMC94175.1 maltose acetyltransferase domain-containing protein [Kineothrix sp. MB12-C1]
MTAKEKMLNGEYYISWDEELTKEREKTKDMLFEFNNVKPSLTNCCILDCAKIAIGDNVWICGGVTITGGVKIGSNTVMVPEAL